MIALEFGMFRGDYAQMRPVREPIIADYHPIAADYHSIAADYHSIAADYHSIAAILRSDDRPVLLSLGLMMDRYCNP